MDESSLISVVYCLCVALKGVEPRRECVNTYVNCAIVGPGDKILTAKEFKDKCAEKVKGVDLSCIGKILNAN
jgi:hypothetical protein